MLAGSPSTFLTGCKPTLPGLFAPRRTARSSAAVAADRPDSELLGLEQRESSAVSESASGSQSTRTAFLKRDPQAKFRQYGESYGGTYVVPDIADWVNGAPRVRLRRPVDRQREQLADLAVLNDRLAGRAGWQIRRRVEFLRTRRRNWEQIYKQLASNDTATTLAMIEEANQKVEAALSEEAQERQSVADLKEQLAQLQAEVHEAHERLHVTQERVDSNMERISNMKAEAADLNRIAALPSADKAAASSRGLRTPRQCVSLQRDGSAGGAPTQSTATLSAESRQQLQTRPQPLQPQPQQQGRNKGLQSSLQLEPGLANHWYPVAFSSRLVKDTLVPFELLGQPWVLFRDETGSVACVRDECAHRACPLSLGSVVDGRIQCPYHGWKYTGSGECVSMPSTRQCGGVCVSSLTCQESDGFVFVWPGSGPAPELPTLATPPEGFVIHAEIEVEVPVEHGLLMENLLDLAHAPFTHTSTFAKGWPIPDAVKFNMAQLMGGSWDPYPIDMSFEPPCCVLSTIGLAQAGKIQKGCRADACKNHLHQLHVCLPSRPGHTRLLYRMSMDFLHWTKFVPGIQQFWKHIAGQVLGEDLVLVKGQQDRMMRGSDTWSFPVSYDKLAVRYRRWRNSLGDPQKAAEQAELASTSKMSAADIFCLEEFECDIRYD